MREAIANDRLRPTRQRHVREYEKRGQSRCEHRGHEQRQLPFDGERSSKLARLGPSRNRLSFDWSHRTSYRRESSATAIVAQVVRTLNIVTAPVNPHIVATNDSLLRE